MAGSLAQERVFDVVVVGAGISGLSAAYDLQKKRPKTKIIILEAKGQKWIAVCTKLFGTYGRILFRT